MSSTYLWTIYRLTVINMNSNAFSMWCECSVSGVQHYPWLRHASRGNVRPAVASAGNTVGHATAAFPRRHRVPHAQRARPIKPSAREATLHAGRVSARRTLFPPTVPQPQRSYFPLAKQCQCCTIPLRLLSHIVLWPLLFNACALCWTLNAHYILAYS